MKVKHEKHMSIKIELLMFLLLDPPSTTLTAPFSSSPTSIASARPFFPTPKF